MKRLAAPVLATLVLAPLASLAADADPARPGPAAPPAASPAGSPARTTVDDFLYKALLAPDAFLNYIQLVPHERRKYRFYARHMNETQRLEYLRRVRSADREKYARDLGLPQMLEEVPEATRERIVAGNIDLGMSRDEVQLALGDPAGKALGAGELNGKHYPAWERWTYQRKSGSFAVWFADGRVVAYDPGSAPPADDSLPPESSGTP